MSHPILSVWCDEPEGKVLRHIYPMAFTEENLSKFWALASQYRTLFSDELHGDFHKFCELFFTMDDPKNVATLRPRGMVWIIDDFIGVYYMTQITTTDASVHYSFFDKRHRGRENMTRELLKYTFDHYGFRRLTTEVPLYVNRFVFGFVARVGFKKEGRKRKCVQYDNEWFDSYWYGILKEEAEAWDQKPSKLVEDQRHLSQMIS